jgi:hypothetical protein
LPDEIYERSGEMRVIKITGFVDRIENRDPLLQEIRRMSSTFDLSNGALSHTGRLEKMALDGSQ